MKKPLAVIIVLLLLLEVLTPAAVAMATDNVSVSTDNFTIGFSDNLTVLNTGNITISGDIGIEGLNDTLDDIIDKVLSAVIGLFIIILLAVLAFWGRDPLIYVLAGFGFLLYGFAFWTTSSYMSILLVIAGITLIAKAWADRKKGK